MNDLQIFNNPNFGSIRSIMRNDEPWFVGKDVATALEYKDTTNAIKKHVDIQDKKIGWQNTTPSIKDKMGRLQTPIWINESGLYSLIFGSKLQKAKEFKRWVTSEVLPTLRKTGSYSVNKFSTEDYFKAAELVAKCKKANLPVLMQFLEQMGFTIPTESEPLCDLDFALVDLLNQFSLRQLVTILKLPKTSLSYYRTGKYKPSPERRQYIIETLQGM